MWASESRPRPLRLCWLPRCSMQPAPAVALKHARPFPLRAGSLRGVGRRATARAASPPGSAPAWESADTRWVRWRVPQGARRLPPSPPLPTPPARCAPAPAATLPPAAAHSSQRRTVARAGGGFGAAVRYAGLASDNLIALTAVDGRGRIVRADATRNSDLLWASRGGGGGRIAIVTSFTFRLMVGPAAGAGNRDAVQRSAVHSRRAGRAPPLSLPRCRRAGAPLPPLAPQDVSMGVVDLHAVIPRAEAVKAVRPSFLARCCCCRTCPAALATPARVPCPAPKCRCPPPPCPPARWRRGRCGSRPCPTLSP